MPKLDEKFYVGELGVNKTWQAPFEKEIHCEKCNNVTKLTFVWIDEKSEDMLVNQPKPDNFDWWFHDSIAFACYICPKCWFSTMIWNQA